METNLPRIEEKILKFWHKNRIFKKSLKKRQNSPRFVFYDGPPFANGLPHYGHLLAMSLKDVILRYKNLRGFYVPRRLGWDCHGLPVEYEIEKELKIQGYKAIEKYGIERFNKKARDSVFRYIDVWESTIERLGRFADFKNTYATLTPSYIESVWWVFKTLFNKGLIYQDFTVQPYCPRCETSLSNFETNQGYKDNVPDPSIFVKFKIKGKKDEYFLTWTTTPWTLPANLALAVGPEIVYGLYRVDREKFWLAEKIAEQLLGKGSEVLDKKQGKDLEDLSYEPLFPLPQLPQNQIQNPSKSYKVFSASFVTLEEGTGIVHLAPAYGEDDMALAKKHNLSIVFATDSQGKMVSQIAKDKFIKNADPLIIDDLEKRGLLWKKGEIKHTYPFCWRCDTPLMYMAVSSWFLKVTSFKEKLVKLNKKIGWHPAHLRDGRFGKWLEGARDWNLSRKRFWGAPIPLWQCQSCGFLKVVGSFQELEESSGGRLKISPNFDPHRPSIDKIEIECPKCQQKMRRIEEVFDCWFESGSMPYAQFHFPFENKYEFKENFPADFIAEGLDQTRGWFYTLHVLAVALFSKPAFKNVVVNGIILDPEGRKLSKRLRNYPEPEKLFSEVGTDSLRQYFYSSASLGEDYCFSEEKILEKTRKVLLPLLNVLRFLEMKKTQVKFQSKKHFSPSHILDKWFLAKFAEVGEEIKSLMDNYEITKASRLLEDLISDFSVWYLRRSRERLDKDFLPNLELFLKTLSIIASPFMPFLSEEIYQKTKRQDEPQGVDLTDWPEFSEKLVDKKLLSQMAIIRVLVELGHRLRKEKNVSVRQPLTALFYDIEGVQGLLPDLEKILLEELNVKKIIDQTELSTESLSAEKDEKKITLDFTLKKALLIEGQIREIVRQIQALRKKAHLLPHQKVILFLEVPQDLKQFIASNKKEIETKTRTKILEKNPTDSCKASSEIKLRKEVVRARLY